MDASAISHIALCVRDMDKSLEFYRDKLGMKVTAEGDTDPTEGGRPHNYKHARRTRRRVSVSYGDESTMPSLTLTSHPGESPDGDAILLDQVGITHLAFVVSDVAALTAELESKGVELAGPRESFVSANGEMRNVYVRDPDGILIQFSAGPGG
jgi:lactoylglutathione lyase